MKVFELFDLSGKVSIVTGGGDGIGRTLATALGEAGSHVVICSRKIDKCEEAAREIEQLGVKTLALQCDISRDEDVDRIVHETMKHFQKIDVLVNNSGRTWGAPPEDISLQDWQKVIDLNVTGTFRISQRVGRVMIGQRSGKIINISSYAGFRGTDPEFLDAIPYNASKGAINTLTRDLAVKWAKYNIHVNAIAPGWFRTKMTQWVFENRRENIFARSLIKRFGEPDDLKGAIVFLASKASDFMTGQILCVDGGLTAW